jgi:hypothetical protein
MRCLKEPDKICENVTYDKCKDCKENPFNPERSSRKCSCGVCLFVWG